MMHAPAKKNIAAKYWTGKISLGYGIGYFSGLAGDNQPHRHYAHQLSFSLNPQEKVTLQIEQQSLQYSGVYLQANTEHQLLAGHYCSIYIDQTHFLAHMIEDYLQPSAAITALPDNLVHLLRSHFVEQNTIQQAFERLIVVLNAKPKVNISTRQQALAEYLTHHPHDDLSLQQMATAFNISTSRFSHWFNESFGISYRSYRKWLRLLQTLQNINQPNNLTDLAHQGQFSDQAHFSRTCKQMFGIQPSLLKYIPEIEALNILMPSGFAPPASR